MVSRLVELGERGEERLAATIIGVAARLVSVLAMACGFVDGDPIVTGGSTLGSSSQGSSSQGSSATAGTVVTGGVDSTLTGGSGMETGLGSDETTAGPPAACGCEGQGPEERCLRLFNACDQSIWAGASGVDEPAGALSVSMLGPDECVAVVVADVQSGRAWAATGCDDDGDNCTSDGGQGRGTLVQFTINAGGVDNYNVTLSDGFNLPVEMRPIGSTTSDPGDEDCQPAGCAADLGVVCPEGLGRPGSGEDQAYCANPCNACDECPGCSSCDPDSPDCSACGDFAEFCCTFTDCDSSRLAQQWMSLCPHALFLGSEGSFFSCTQQPDYDLVFCP